MKHVEDISSLVKTLVQSSTFHALVIQSPPGFGKSTTIDRVFKELGISQFSIGSYSTPLALYNAMCTVTQDVLLIDDCSGIFNDPTALSLLKAATWPNSSENERRISWASTSDKVKAPTAVFNAKIILLVNSMPMGNEVQAFLSRTLYLKIRFSSEEINTLLYEATTSSPFFENQVIAKEVADYLVSRLESESENMINLRTLKLGYELAKTHSDTWRHLLEKLLPPPAPRRIAKELIESASEVEDQVKEFQRATGLSRRTFFNYKQELIRT